MGDSLLLFFFPPQHATVENRDNPQTRFELNRQFCNKINNSILQAEQDHKVLASLLQRDLIHAYFFFSQKGQLFKSSA